MHPGFDAFLLFMLFLLVMLFKFLVHLILRKASNLLLALELKQAIAEFGIKNFFKVLSKQIEHLVDEFLPTLDVL